MLLQGVAGTGKSFIIKTLKDILKEKLIICALTGCASHNVKGQTIHSILKLNTNLDNYEKLKSDKQLTKVIDNFENVKYIILDEYSMVGCKLLGNIDKRLR